MSKDLEVGVKITADGKGLVGEARASKDALNQLGDSTRKVSNESAALTSQTTAQTASLASMKTGLIAAAGAYVSFSSAMAGGKALIETALANERLNNTLIVATGSAEAAARETAFLRDASEKLGLQFVTNASQYAKLAAAAKGTALEGQATRDIFLAVSKAATVLGMSVADASGSLLAIQQMISKGKVSAEELRGQFGERVPGAFEMAARAIGVTTAELDKMLEQGQVTAERLLPALAKELEATYGAQAQAAAQGLNAKINRLDNSFSDLKTTIGNTGLIDLLSDGIVLATRFVDALSGAKVLSAVDAQKQKIAEMRDELESLTNRKLAGNAFIPKLGDLIFDKAQADLLSQRINDGIADLKKLENAAKESAETLSGKKAVTPGVKPELPKEWAAAAEKAASAREKAAAAAEREMQRMVDGSTRIIAALKLETEQIGLNAIQKKMLVAATEAAKSPTEELAQEIMASAQAWALATQRQEELMAAEKDRLEGIKAVEKAEQAAAQAAQESARQSQQQWNQLWGNVEQTAKTAFVQFAAHGKNAMESIGQSLKVAVIDALYQLTVRRWMINIGASLEGAFSGTAGATGGSSTVGMLASLASMFSGTRTAGINTSTSAGVFGGGSSAGTAFIGGPGTAIGGSVSGRSSTGLSSVMSLASLAGPYGMAAAAAFTVLSALEKKVGDYELKGGAKFALGAYETFSPMSYAVKGLGLQTPEALIGKFLFGRGPYKFRQQSIQGDITSEGLDGTMTDVLRSKGAVFTSNRHRSFEYGIPSEVIRDIDKSIKGIYQSSHEFALNLGLDANLVDSYTKQIQVKSEKGKALTTEAIGEMLTGLSDEIAKSVMPNIDDFRLTGESAGKAFERLNSELDALKAGVENLGGSVAYAKQLINSMSIDERSALIDRAGGIDRLGQLTSAFFDGFLTDAEKLAVRTDQLSSSLSDLGLSTDITRDQYRALVQSTDTSNDLRISLLELAPAFLQVRAASGQLVDAETQRAVAMGTAFGALQRSIGAERDKITKDYEVALNKVNGHIDGVTQSIGKLKSLSEALKSTVSQIIPMSRDAAKRQIMDAISTARAGGALPEADSLREALGTLGKGAPGFTGSFEYAREQAKTANLVADLGKLTDDQLTLDERSLAALEAQRDRLTEGFKAETDRLDGLLTQGQAQIDALSGISAGVISLADALKQFNAASYSAGGGAIGGESLGNAAISAQQIRDYFSTARTPQEIASDAGKYGVSSAQIVATGRFTQAEADKFFKDNPDIPRFAKGGFHSGGLRIVGEKGPELESTGPARITSNNDLAKLLSNDDVVAKLSALIQEIQTNNTLNRRVANKLDAVTVQTPKGQVALRTGT